MPIITDFPQGTPIWVDLHTTDADDAAQFYAGLFGWDLTPPSPESGPFWQASRGAAPICAIGGLPEPLVDRGAEPAWTTYLAVDDADAVVDAIPAAGGSVLLPPGEPGAQVRLVIATDPIGAVIGLWQGGAVPGTWLRDEPGTVTWFELLGDGAADALAFYETALGLSVSTLPMGEVDYAMLAASDAPFAGTADLDVPNGAAAWRVYFEVADLDAALASAVELGATPIGTPGAAAGVGRWSAIRDPQGALFSLLENEHDTPAADSEAESDATIETSIVETEGADERPHDESEAGGQAASSTAR